MCTRVHRAQPSQARAERGGWNQRELKLQVPYLNSFDEHLCIICISTNKNYRKSPTLAAHAAVPLATASRTSRGAHERQGSSGEAWHSRSPAPGDTAEGPTWGRCHHLPLRSTKCGRREVPEGPLNQGLLNHCSLQHTSNQRPEAKVPPAGTRSVDFPEPPNLEYLKLPPEGALGIGYVPVTSRSQAKCHRSPKEHRRTQQEEPATPKLPLQKLESGGLQRALGSADSDDRRAAVLTAVQAVASAAQTLGSAAEPFNSNWWALKGESLCSICS